MAFMKYCNKVGCNRLIPQGKRYCSVHTLNTTEANRERHREYDKNRRNKKAKNFYNSREWQMTRAKVLARDNGIDIYLYITEGRIVKADMVHHIVELSKDYEKRCEMTNLISLSEHTHKTVIERAYNDEKKREEMQKKLRQCIDDFLTIKRGEGL